MGDEYVSISYLGQFKGIWLVALKIKCKLRRALACSSTAILMRSHFGS